MSEAQALLEQRRYEDALRQAQLKLWSGELSAADTVSAYYIIGMCQLWLEQYFAAIHSLSTARTRAEEQKHPDAAVTELYLGVAYLWLGDLYEAKQALHRALAYPTLKLPQQGIATFNLGVIEEVDGRFQDARSYYFVARDLLRIANQSDRARACTLAIAWCYLLQQDSSSARPFLDELQVECTAAGSPALQELVAPHWALYHRLEGDLSTSMQFCEKAMAACQLTKRDYHNTVGEAAWIAGLNAISMDRFEEARLFAQQATNHGLHLQWPSLVNRAHKLRLTAQRTAKQQ